MIRYSALICCLFITFIALAEEKEDKLLTSTPEQISTLTCEPDFLIGGLINPLSGQLSLRQTDMIAKGAQDIVLSRIYIPPYIPQTFFPHKTNQEEWHKYHLSTYLNENYQGWQYLPHLKLQYTPSLFKDEIRLTDPNGTTIDFLLNGINAETKLHSPPYAISNTKGDTPSGKYDPRNTKIFCQGEKITVYAPDGTKRHYQKKGLLKARTTYLYLLHKEQLPNGKILKYHYNNQDLTTIESMDPKERHTYSTIQIQGTPPQGNCRFITTTGQTTHYHFEKRPLTINIKEKDLKITSSLHLPPILTKVSSPLYRYENNDYQNHLLNTHNGKNNTFTCQYTPTGKTPHYKIHKLLYPTGPKDTPSPIYELTYQPPIPGQKEGTTTAKNQDGTTTTYHYTKNLLLTKIQYFQNNTLKKEKLLTWTDNNWLKTIEIKDGQNPPLSQNL